MRTIRIFAALALGLAADAAFAQTGPCDLYAAGGTPCIAAHSTVRALYGAYTGNLYRVRRASDNTSRDIGVLGAGGYADAAAQDAFCSGTTCVVTMLYDQSGKGNHLEYQGAGSSVGGQDDPAVATREPLTVAGHKVYALYIQSGNSYWRNGSRTGVPTGSAPEGMYMVTSGTHVNSGCCFDYGNSETDRKADGAGAMDAINFSTSCWFGGCSGTGPWVQADLEYGLFPGGSSSWNSNQRAFTSTYVTAMLKNNGTTRMALKGASAQSGSLTTLWNGSLPPGYNPMKKQGAIILGSGGDCCATNRNLSVGTFYEGAMVAGYPSDATDDAVQANVVAAGYGAAGTSYPLTVARAGTGAGAVASTPSGISCGNTCSASYASGTTVTLTASATGGSTFGGWSGACTGSGACIVSMTAARTVTASFTGPGSSSSGSSSSSGGGAGVYLDAGGAAVGSYAADQYFSGGSTYTNSNTIDTSLLGAGAPPAAAFQSERYGTFTYTIPGLAAGAPYTVTLYFAETYVTSAGARVFSVSANGTTVLSNFDIYAAAGGQNKAIGRAFGTSANGSGQIVLQFVAGTQNPKVNAIAVVAGGSSSSSSGGSSSSSSSSSGGGGSSSSSSSSSSGGSSSGGGACKAVSGGQSGNFNTTGASCFTVSGTVNGWGCSNADGRTVTVNGTATTCGKLPLPGSAPYTFSFSAGTYTWASFYWW